MIDGGGRGEFISVRTPNQDQQEEYHVREVEYIEVHGDTSTKGLTQRSK